MDPNQEPSLILSQGVIKLEDPDPMIMDPNHQSGFFKTSPARDALSELLEMPVTNEDSVSNDIMSGDANSLIVDLNDLLKRDPTLSSLSDDPVIGNFLQ